MAIIEGTEFNNELIVTGTGDEVLGLAGNDTLDASPAQGNNTLDGGSGDDELFAGIDDLLLGGEGDDTLDARSGRGGNRLEAGEGNDLLFAATDDTLLGGIGNDLLFAGREDGVLKGGTGSDQFWVVQTEVPVQPNIVNRFIQGVDQIGIGGLAEYVTAFEDLSFVMQEGSTVIQATVEGEDVELAILEGFTGTLTADDFIFNQGAPALAVPGPVAEDAAFSVPENSEVGTVVGTVIATDIEITDDPEDSDQLTYEIIAGNADPNGNGTAAFTINQDTGEITVLDSGDLDFESDTTSFELTVKVTDLEGLSDEATVTINVENVNEAPVAADAEFTIDENSADGTEVGTVVAIDPDSGDTLTYVISAGNDAGAFEINETTGEITVANSAPLDFETTASFDLTVTVSDGELTDDATVTINLNNLPEEGNDRPEIQDAEFTIDENSADGTEVGTVIATDLDGNILSYSITGGNDSGAFTIDPATGLITVVNSAPLDFETTPSFGLTVTVSDGELTDDATVTINLNDIDEDGDGVIDSIERIAGDRNRDGIEDVEQSNVASVPSLVPGEFFTLVAPEGIQFTNVEVTADFNSDGIDNELIDPTGNGFSFLDGFLDYEIRSLDPNEPLGDLLDDGRRQLDISILLPEGTNANTYFKFNSVTSQLEEFTYDGETGAEFFDTDDDADSGNDDVDLVVLHFIDGGRGDDDGLANGVITDPGGVGLLATPDGSLTENGGIFTVGGTSGLAVPLKFTLTENDSAFVDRMKVFRLDENNNLLSEEVIFSEVHTGLTEGLTRELQFTAGDRLEFSIETPATTFSLFRDSDQVRISELENGGYNLAWEDVNLDELLFGGDFNDFVFNVEVGDTLGLDQLVAIDQGEEERELLDLRQLPGQTVEVDITVNRDAAFDNFVGFYRVDAEGRVLDEFGNAVSALPTDSDEYRGQAIANRVTNLDSSTVNNGTLDGGFLYAPFIIPDLGTTSPDDLSTFENVYVPYTAANADNFDHVRLLGDNVFGFEDLFGGGDQDFNDIVVALDFTLI